MTAPRTTATAAIALVAIAHAAPDGSERGKELYADHCLMCHQATGLGMPPVFPPLAQSEHVVAEHPEFAIRAIVAGLSGKISVGGTIYDGAMPPAFLKDDEVADVLTFVRSSWGNDAGPVTPEAVAAVRATTAYPTFQDLAASQTHPPFPPTPDGIDLREVVRLDDFVVRLAPSQEPGRLLALVRTGDVLSIDIATGASSRVVEGSAYVPRGGFSRGLCLTREGDLFISSNRIDEEAEPVANEVTIFRAKAPRADAGTVVLRPWFRTVFPAGIGGFNHAVSHIAQGPDGLLYVGSGSRTDGAEAGDSPRHSTAGEDLLTACLWRLDPTEESNPYLEIYARGLRNPYGFTWDADGALFATDNGPDAHRPEELNIVAEGKHYGFPYQFGADPASDKPYPYTPDPPKHLRFTTPVIDSRSGLATFSPHSCPCGIAYLDGDFPGAYADSFVIARFGNLLRLDQDVGFDVVHATVDRSTGQWSFSTLLAPLGRPLDVIRTDPGQLCLLEYSRSTTYRGAGPAQPGRIVEISFR